MRWVRCFSWQFPQFPQFPPVSLGHSRRSPCCLAFLLSFRCASFHLCLRRSNELLLCSTCSRFHGLFSRCFPICRLFTFEMVVPSTRTTFLPPSLSLFLPTRLPHSVSFFAIRWICKLKYFLYLSAFQTGSSTLIEIDMLIHILPSPFVSVPHIQLLPNELYFALSLPSSYPLTQFKPNRKPRSKSSHSYPSH